MIPTVWYRWLLIAVWMLMIFGLSMVLWPEGIRSGFSLMVYGSPTAIELQFSAAANAYVIFVHGVLGAVMFGWGLAMLITLAGPFRRGETVGWKLLALPLVAWFVPDTVFSLYTGFWQNAVLNTGFALLFAIPLVATRRVFFEGSEI